ncbi:MAG: hypothetical protein LUQ50_04985 [Methanospirillum sp.]|nr:hypothetical protein [Methanospirillum sp.]MDD1728411.1 hypothetical protein [Methanospirillum sp.]
MPQNTHCFIFWVILLHYNVTSYQGKVTDTRIPGPRVRILPGMNAEKR